MACRSKSTTSESKKWEPQELNGAALRRAGVHPAVTGLTGAGVVICVIDYGFDLCHPSLRTSAGETRFAALIDQNGKRLERAGINRLLRAVDRTGDRAPLDALYDPHANAFGDQGVVVGAHGSWVASLAAGSRVPGFTGVAPAAILIGVHLALPDPAWREVDADGRPTWLPVARQGGAALAGWTGWRSYEDSRPIAAALREGFACARALRPDGIVFNLSVGAWAGSHASGDRIDRALTAILADGCGSARDLGQCVGQRARGPGVSGQRDLLQSETPRTAELGDGPMIAAVAATGNAGADRGHVCGPLDASRPLRFVWAFDPVCAGPSKLEIWADGVGAFAVALRTRSAGGALSVVLDETMRGTRALITTDGRIVGIAENRGTVRDGLSCVRLILHPSLPVPPLRTAQGCAFDVEVRVGVTTRRADGEGWAHAWVERGGMARPTATLVDVGGRTAAATAHESSLSSLACAASVIPVAGLDQCQDEASALALSGCGPRPWRRRGERPAPLIAAPAHRLFGARSKTTGYMRGSGTSAAAALVSGAAALAMQAAHRAGRQLDHEQLLSALLGRAPDDTSTWRTDIGFGALCLDPRAGLAGVARPVPRRSPGTHTDEVARACNEAQACKENAAHVHKENDAHERTVPTAN